MVRAHIHNAWGKAFYRVACLTLFRSRFVCADLQINPLNGELKGFAWSAIWIGCRGSVRPGQANFHVRPPINLDVWIFTFATLSGWSLLTCEYQLLSVDAKDKCGYFLSFVCCADSILLLPPSLPREQFLLSDENSSISFSWQNYPHIWGKKGFGEWVQNIQLHIWTFFLWFIGPINFHGLFGYIHLLDFLDWSWPPAPFWYPVQKNLLLRPFLIYHQNFWKTVPASQLINIRKCFFSSFLPVLLICGRIRYRWISAVGRPGGVMANLIGGRRGVCQPPAISQTPPRL